MTDPFQTFLEHLSTWQVRLGLERWDISGHAKVEDSYPDRTIAACTMVDWPHMIVTIDVNEEALTGMDDKEIESIALHELLHACLRELTEAKGSDAYKHEERCVTILEMAISDLGH